MPSSNLARHPDPDRLLGCLLGGAIGDALGAPIEGLDLARIREKYGEEGLREYSADRVSPGAITDDTQLTMFTARALIQASVRARAKGIGGATTGLLQSAYLTWLRGQGERIPRQDLAGGGWLEREKVLMTRRGPGRTTLSALHEAARRRWPGWPLGTVAEPINDSKRCGGVMRTAPCGFPPASLENAFDLGCEAAALTHGHPTGYLPAGVLAAVVYGLVRGADLGTAVERARAVLETREGHAETSAALEASVELAAQGPLTPERLESLGGGWTGEEALAIAVCTALNVPEFAPPAPFGPPRGWEPVVRHGLLLAVNHSGDSDTTGAICGNLLGAQYGSAAFPGHWQAELEVRRAVIQMAADCSLELGPVPPTQPDDYGTPSWEWLARYSDG